MIKCEEAQAQLAEQGSPALARDPLLQAHVESCADCSAFSARLRRLESYMTQLPVYAAPAGLLDKTKNRINNGEHGTIAARRRPDSHYWIASAALVVLAVALTWTISPTLMRFDEHALVGNFSVRQQTVSKSSTDGLSSEFFRASEEQRIESSADETFSNAVPARAIEKESGRRELGAETRARERLDVGAGDRPASIVIQSRDDLDQIASSSEVSGLVLGDAIVPSEEPANAPAASDEKSAEKSQLSLFGKLQPSAGKDRDGRLGQKPNANKQSLAKPDQNILPDSQNAGQAGQYLESELAKNERSNFSLSEASEENDALSYAQNREPEPQSEATIGDITSVREEKKRLPAPADPNITVAKTKPRRPIASSPAEQFLRQRDSLDHLQFQPADGYWANTYIPGDPQLRRLQARLRGADWAQLGLPADSQQMIERTASPHRQPFDAPDNSALALYVHADKAAINPESRLRIQIGLKGALRRGGQRPAMNIGVVVDLGDSDAKRIGPRLSALLSALAQAKQPGDRFSLISTGHPGKVLIAPGQFRHGTVTIAMRTLVDTSSANQRMDLSDALALATANVLQSDDPGAPLGSSLVLLISPRPVADSSALSELETLAHVNASNGVHLSIVSLGDDAGAENARRLVLAGHGNLRRLAAAEQAASVIDEELYAASRAVARALRLRIRLAPDVKLIDVIGSRRLDAVASERVRAAEKSIDQRLSRNLGIRADRGDDEQGIQIVIPQFLAGAEHIVMLDVVAARPGPVADVRVRYKDLVYSRNGVASAQLTLASGAAALSPLQQNVIKNHLLLTMIEAVQEASAHLSGNRYAQALSQLRTMRDLLKDMRSRFPNWSQDHELTADQALLDGYLNFLTTANNALPDNAARSQQLAASLRYAAHRKLLGDSLDE